MSQQFPIYRVFTSPGELAGERVFELHPDDFPDGVVRRWNEGSLYLTLEAMAPFAPLLGREAGNFLRRETRLAGPPLERILRRLAAFSAGLRDAASVADLVGLSTAIRVEAPAFAIGQAQLIRTTEALAAAVWRSASTHRGFWILGLSRPG